MAAPVQQPEMAELPGGPAVQPSATAMHDGRGALEGNTSSSTAAAAARSDVYPEHTMNASNNEPVHASMHAINATSNNDDGAVRGADDELAASTTADNATITSQRSEEGLKGISSLQSAPASLPVQAAQTHKDRLPPSKTDFDAPRDSQEKGDQITLELVSLLRISTKHFRRVSQLTVACTIALIAPSVWSAEAFLFQAHRHR